METLAGRVWQSTGILNFLQLSRCPLSRAGDSFNPVWWRGAETIKQSVTGKRFFGNLSDFFAGEREDLTRRSANRGAKRVRRK
jgi:hypothetical protein